ncbi:MAG TPA: methyltransferase domain-containing protein [Jatrophihabitans sp.]
MSVEVYVSVLGPSLFEPWAELLADALDPRPGSTVVDVASGPGTVARVLARRVGAIGHVYGCDLSAEMLAAATEVPAASGAGAIEYLACPADELPLTDASVDAVACQQGLQFFPDQVGALAEMHRVARPGARLAVSVWRTIDRMPIYATLVEAAEEVLGDAGGLRTVPFSLSDAARLTSLARAAGWTGVGVEARDLPVEFPSVAAVLRAYAVTPVAEAVRALPAERADALEAALRARLAPLIDPDGAVRSTTGAHFLTATA